MSMATINKMVRAHIFIEGRVQGVFYRSWTQRQAEKLGLTGWVKNLEDGRVEVVAEGEKENLSKLIEAVKKGPPLSKVEHLDIIWEEATGEFGEFEIFK